MHMQKVSLHTSLLICLRIFSEGLITYQVESHISSLTSLFLAFPDELHPYLGFMMCRCSRIHSSCAIFCRYMGMGYGIFPSYSMPIYIPSSFFVCVSSSIIFVMLLNQASDQPFSIEPEEIDKRIEERIDGELLFLNGDSFLSSTTLNKTISTS